MNDLTDDEIAAQYSTAKPEAAEANALSDDDIANLYSSAKPQSAAEAAAESMRKSVIHKDAGSTGKLILGTIEGLKNVHNSAMQMADYLHTKIFGEDEKSRALQERIKQQNATFEKEHGGEGEGAARAGQFIGQAIATAPAGYARPFQAAFRALPTVSSLGIKEAAPPINRLASSIAQGATSGGAFGAGINSTNEEGVGSNVGKGMILGAVAGPVIATAGMAGNKTIDMVKDTWKYVNTDALARLNGIDTNAAIKIVRKLQDAGFSPQDAQRELTKMGPKATIADLDEALVSDVRALAQSGGKPTTILKGVYKTRAEEANNETMDLMHNVLGPKPDIEMEKKGILDQARSIAGPSYRAAHANPASLDVSNVVSDIDKRLKVAVGKERDALETAKSFLFEKDAQGKPKLKTNVESLHAVREALDDTLDSFPQEGTSAKSHTYSAVEKVRGGIDEELKTIPEMKTADEVFHAKMNERSGMQYGYDAFKKVTNFESFKREFDAATPEVQTAIKKGMHSKIGDMIESAQRGEYAGAQQLLGKRSLNRKMVKYALGHSGDVVLEGLKNEAALRDTEKAALTGTHTAGNQMIQADWGLRPSGGSAFGEAAKALPFDLIGAGGAAAGISFARKSGQNILLQMSQNRTLRTAETGADLLSRQGAARDSALSILERVSAVQNRMKNPTMLRLPVSISGPAGEAAYKQYNSKNK